MKTLFLDCSMGAAGDMLSAALMELLPDQESFLAQLNGLGIQGAAVTSEKTEKCGITGTHFKVTIHGEEESEEMHLHAQEARNAMETAHHGQEEHHHHRSMHEVRQIIEALGLSDKVKTDILSVYTLIAEAESHVHGAPVTEIHFHEVGTMDAIIDITAFCMLMDRLSPDKVIASPVCVGSGQVRCAHGVLPVPAPATAYILQGIPTYSGTISGELCTPTGAALLKHFVNRFGGQPLMRVSAIGYGMGAKDYPAANCVRAMLGEDTDKGDVITELSCNLDDMTAEEIGFTQQELLTAGALDVFTVPVQMKKSRPGALLTVLCREEDRERILRCIFLHTTTLGVRENISRRYILSRTEETVQTSYGKVRKKVSSGYGVQREKYEYDDIARIAVEKGSSLRKITEEIRRQENDRK